MDYIQSSNKQEDKFGVGEHGFSAGNPTGGVPATFFTPDWSDAVQQELINTVKAGGVVPAAGVLTQLRQALKRMFGGNLTTVNFAASPFALTRDHAGIVIIDAIAGSVVLTLPAANLLAGLPYEFRRSDSSVNTVTINRAGADVIDEADTSIVLPPKAVRRIRADGATGWLSLNASVASQAEVNAGTDDAKFVSSKKLRAGFAMSLTSNGYIAFPTWLGGLIVQWGNTAHTGVAIGWTYPVAFPVACFTVFSNIRTDNGASVVISFSATSAEGTALVDGSNASGSHNYNWLAMGH